METRAAQTSHVMPKLKEISEWQGPKYPNPKPHLPSNEVLYTFKTYSGGTMDPAPIGLTPDSRTQREPSMGASHEPEQPVREDYFADLQTTWPERHASRGFQMAPVIIEAAGHVEAASGSPAKSNELRQSSFQSNGMDAGQTAAFASSIVMLIVGSIGLGTWVWKMFRKRRREDDEYTDVEEEIDVNGDTEDGGSGPTRKLRRRFHSRDWHHCRNHR